MADESLTPQEYDIMRDITLSGGGYKFFGSRRAALQHLGDGGSLTVLYHDGEYPRIQGHSAVLFIHSNGKTYVSLYTALTTIDASVTLPDAALALDFAIAYVRAHYGQ